MATLLLATPAIATPITVFCDGGMVGPNPTREAVTWAYRYVAIEAGETRGVYRQRAGAVAARFFPDGEATNNHAELLALVNALAALSPGRRLVLWCDSQVTLARLKTGRAANVPGWLRERLEDAHARTRPGAELRLLEVVNCAGHPTLLELEAGRDRAGRLVHAENVWCDRACRHAGRRWSEAGRPDSLELSGHEIPSDWRQMPAS